MAAMASSTLRPQALITHAGNQIEVSVHTAPRAVLRELRQVFGGRVSLDDAVVCLPTSQNTSIELVNWGDEAAGEKDRCLETFAAFGEAMRARPARDTSAAPGRGDAAGTSRGDWGAATPRGRVAAPCRWDESRRRRGDESRGQVAAPGRWDESRRHRGDECGDESRRRRGDEARG